MRAKKHPCESCKITPVPYCKECRKRTQENWRLANLRKAKECSKQWREANPEKSKQYLNHWNQANPEKSKKYFKHWYEANREKLNEHRNRSYYKKYWGEVSEERKLLNELKREIENQIGGK